MVDIDTKTLEELNNEYLEKKDHCNVLQKKLESTEREYKLILMKAESFEEDLKNQLSILLAAIEENAEVNRQIWARDPRCKLASNA